MRAQEEQLTEYINARMNLPFSWGFNDCVTFTIKAVEAYLQVDILTKIAPWKNQQEAEIVLKSLGGCFSESLNTGLLRTNFTQIRPSETKKGDVSLFDMGKGPTLVFDLGDLVCSPGFEGLIFHRKDDRFFSTARSYRYDLHRWEATWPRQ